MDKTRYIIQDKIKTAWNTLAQNKRIHDYDMAAYMITKAMFSKSNEKLEVAKALLLRAFSPITNYNKLHNGCSPFDGLRQAVNGASWSTIVSLLDTRQCAEFKELTRLLCSPKESWKDPHICYIITRTDIPSIHQLVQTAHATMVAGQRYPGLDARNLHFCILAGGTEDQLRETGKELTRRNIDYATFWEPDASALWGGLPRKEITSIACKPMRRSEATRKKIFEGKSLLTI